MDVMLCHLHKALQLMMDDCLEEKCSHYLHPHLLAFASSIPQVSYAASQLYWPDKKLKNEKI